MSWCFSTKASVATGLSTHPDVSSCLWVKSIWHIGIISSISAYESSLLSHCKDQWHCYAEPITQWCYAIPVLNPGLHWSSSTQAANIHSSFNWRHHEFSLGSIKIYLYFLSFLNTEMAQVVEILHHRRQWHLWNVTEISSEGSIANKWSWVQLITHI